MQREFTVGHAARRTIASYTTYADAQRVVDFLADQKFPVQHVAIVAEGVALCRAGDWTRGHRPGTGWWGATGAMTGGCFGLIFGLLNWIAPVLSVLELAVYGAGYGALMSAILGLTGFLVMGGRHNFASFRGMQADHYNVMVDAEQAEQAEIEAYAHAAN